VARVEERRRWEQRKEPATMPCRHEQGKAAAAVQEWANGSHLCGGGDLAFVPLWLDGDLGREWMMNGELLRERERELGWWLFCWGDGWLDGELPLSLLSLFILRFRVMAD
jgi:hypothetical protein